MFHDLDSLTTIVELSYVTATSTVRRVDRDLTKRQPDSRQLVVVQVVELS